MENIENLKMEHSFSMASGDIDYSNCSMDLKDPKTGKKIWLAEFGSERRFDEGQWLTYENLSEICIVIENAFAMRRQLEKTKELLQKIIKEEKIPIKEVIEREKEINLFLVDLEKEIKTEQEG